MIFFKQQLKYFLLWGLLLSTSAQLWAYEEVEGADSKQNNYQQVEVAEAFIELHTGPGRGFPVFHIVEKGEKISLIKRRTQWYKVSSPRGVSGWVPQRKLLKTLNLEGQNYQTDELAQQDYFNRSFEAGVLSGDFGGATVMSLNTIWNWTSNLGAELSYSQAIGNVSDIQFANVSILHQAFPEWRISPYVKIGAGVIKTKPNATLIVAPDREDEMVHAGVGVRVYVSRQFFIRAEYNSHTILTSRNDNDEVEEWKLGFSVFF